MRINLLKNMDFFIFLGFSFFLFFFIFGIPTPLGSLTPLLTLIVISFALINYKKFFMSMPKEIFYFFIFLFFDFLICLVIPTVFGTYDFGIIQTKVNFIASMFATYIIAKYLALDKKITYDRFFKLLMCVFLIQILLVVSMLLSSDLSQKITSFTRSSEQGVRVLESYAGARGLGIADSSAFGFAIVMGLFIFLTFFSYKNRYIGFKYFFILLLLGSVASVSAGRTAFLGFILGLFYLLLEFKNKRAFYSLLSLLVIFFSIGLILVGIDRNSIENETLGFFYSYSMEPILNYIATGSFSSTSTEALQNMYFPLSEKQYLIGDGRYTDGSSYYMATDAGYMRFVLFYGSFFSAILYFFFSYFVLKVISKNKKYFASFFLFLLIFSFLLHYKGEVVLFSIAYNKLLFLILFYFCLRNFNIDRNI